MALGAPVPPPGSVNGGGFFSDIRNKFSGGGNPSNPMSSQQQAAMNWLQGASGLNLSQYRSTLSGLGAQRNALNAAYGAASGAAGRDYSLTVRGIDQDLMYGNQLRGEERYRNVDLGRERSAIDLQNAGGIWNIIKQDLHRRKGFANRGFGLANQRTTAQYDTGMRETASDAIARGARTARGTLDRFGDVQTGRNIGLGENRLQLDSTLGGITNEYARGARAFNYANQGYGIDMKTFNSIAKTYGIQAAQAAAQAALGKERAAASRSAASGGAYAQRAQSLAGLASGQSSAYNNYMEKQMGLMSQLLGMR